MADATSDRPFFAGTVDLDAELYVQLDLGDQPVTVSAAYRVQALDGTTCQQSIARTVTGYRHVLLPRDCYAGAYRPKTVVMACGDGNFQLHRLRWRHWNRAVATARGTAWQNDCDPFCFNGTFRHYAARVRAWRIRRCSHDSDRYRYTRVRVSYPGARPPGHRARETFHIACLTST